MENVKGKDLFNIAVDLGFIRVLSESSIKILVSLKAVNAQRDIKSLYSRIYNSTGLSHVSIYNGLKELKFFCIIKSSKKNISIIYDFTKISRPVLEYFFNSRLKTIVLKYYTRKEFDNSDWIYIKDILTSGSEDIKYFLSKIIYLKSIDKVCNIVQILFGGITMCDFVFTEEDMKNIIDKKVDTKKIIEVSKENRVNRITEGKSSFENDSLKWHEILTPQEINSKYLLDVLDFYATYVGIPDREDVDLIKIAYEKCFPYQIKNAIKIIKENKSYGNKFTKFSYIYKRVIRGEFGTRENSRANKIKNDTSVKKTDAQKYSSKHMSRKDFITSIGDNNEKVGNGGI